MKRSFLFLFTTSVLLCFSCIKEPKFSKVPEIKIKEIRQSGAQIHDGDSVIVVLEFKDGDGDLGKNSQTDTIPNLFIVDHRFSIIDSQSYSIPNIPKKGSVDAISGEIAINLLSKIFCNPIHPPSEATDTLEFEFYIRDRAGNFSNQVSTGKMPILCQ
ncbi:MAG: hypothetical protein M9887_07435 [Chitinophagales bacterium]|nr:hypothetical protein [Chitinophagales bacterium]